MGIGFIMVAAIFPVAIQQSQINTQESISASVVRGAVNYMEQIAAGSDNNLVGANVTPLFPATAGQVIASPFTLSGQPGAYGDYAPAMDAQWQQLRGNAILPDDPRFAFVSLYRRNGTISGASPMLQDPKWDGYAQIIVVAVQSRNRPVYTSTSAHPTNAPAASTKMPFLAELQPQPELINVEDNGGGPGVDVIRFWKKDKPFDTLVGAVAEGAFVIVAKDGLTGANQGLMNGRIYKVGARRTDLDGTTNNYEAWELALGADFSPDGGADTILGTPPGGTVAPGKDDILGIGDTTTPRDFDTASKYADAFVVGRGFADPATTPTSRAGYEGTSMAISAYATWIRVK